MAQRPTLQDEICARVAGLALSPLATRILEIPRKEKSADQRLAGLIATDPLLAARLIKLVNLALGQQQRVSNLSSAITAMGVDAIKSLVLGVITFTLRSAAGKADGSETGDGPITLRELWEHAIGCAVVATRIATQIDGVSRSRAFAGGFLHDIGRWLLYHCSRDSFYTTISVASVKSIPLSEAETLAAGVNHVSLGAIWAGRSELPYALQLVMRHHHDPAWMLPKSMDVESRTLIAVVQLADLIYEGQVIGRSNATEIVPRELWETLGLGEQGWSDPFKTIKREVQAVRTSVRFSGEDLKRTQTIDQRQTCGRRRLALGASRGRVIPFPRRNESVATAQTKTSAQKPTILVVEDHGSLCEMLSSYFGRYGYRIRAADSGRAALKVLAKEKIHFVLLDLINPQTNGLGLLKDLREKRQESLPYVIVFFTGASEWHRSNVLELGADEYMPRPFRLTRLLERIQTVEQYLI